VELFYTGYRSKLKGKTKIKDLLIIDGYNFIFRFFKSKGLSSESLEYLREKLIEDLIWYKSQKDCDVTVVFDARKSDNTAAGARIIDGIKVIFSRRGRSADDIIEALISNKSNYRRTFVVTSDYLQQKVIFRKNIYRKSTREFNLEINNYRDEVREDIKKMKEGSESTFFSFEKRLNSRVRKKLLELREKSD
jgi:predicted RNA-binding protein with PIN domain